MLFNSYEFVLLFLPLTLLGYYLFNRYIPKCGNTVSKIWLLAASLYFYSYFNRMYLLIIAASIVINYVLSLIMLKSDKTVLRKFAFVVGLVANIGCLFYYKYYDFFIENTNALFGASFALKNIVLPLGISFFTFQQLSYVIDSYKKTVPQYNILDYSLFVTFFPQLIAGPIVLHNEVVPQFAKEENQRFQNKNFGKGIFAFSIGLAKKVLLADTFGSIADWGFETIWTLGTVNAIIVILAYALQIYLDFSAYCDMAFGIGYMFNIELPANFNSPYKAVTINDFWNRWHMTLTRFLTTYVYIPLGGNRKGKARTYINIFIVFLVSGIWHGANWTFIVWGILHGVGIAFCKFARLNSVKGKFAKLVLRIVTFGFVCGTWVIFRADSILHALRIYNQVFQFKGFSVDEKIIGAFKFPEFTYVLEHIPVIGGYLLSGVTAAAFVLCLVGVFVFKNTKELTDGFNEPKWYHSIISSSLIIWSVLSFAGVSSFLYWNF